MFPRIWAGGRLDDNGIGIVRFPSESLPGSFSSLGPRTMTASGNTFTKICLKCQSMEAHMVPIPFAKVEPSFSSSKSKEALLRFVTRVDGHMEQTNH
jgi:hypothetical protein